MIEGLILDYGGVVIHEDPADYEAFDRSLGLSSGELWSVVHSIPDAIVCSGDEGVAKPDPESFRLAARRLDVPVERCAFVDDVESNVVAARELGMQAMVYHHARHEELVDALRRWQLVE